LEERNIILFSVVLSDDRYESLTKILEVDPTLRIEDREIVEVNEGDRITNVNSILVAGSIFC
jgi:hypothetical protein